MSLKWLDVKTLLVLCTVIGTAFVANYRLGQIEKGQNSDTLKIAAVEVEIQDLKLEILGVKNDVSANREKLTERKEFVSSVKKALEDHGETLIRQEMSLKQQGETMRQILRKLN